MMQRVTAVGIYLPPSQFEAWLLSLAHTRRDIQLTLTAAETALKEIGRKAEG